MSVVGECGGEQPSSLLEAARMLGQRSRLPAGLMVTAMRRRVPKERPSITASFTEGIIGLTGAAIALVLAPGGRSARARRAPSRVVQIV